MCGIFGLIRNANAANPERASAAFVELGRLSVERGRDSAGFALTNPVENNGSRTARLPSVREVGSRQSNIDGVTIVKDVCSFDDLWDDEHHLPLLAEHRVALGHTRWATQGKRDALTNASPIAVGALVGTHNGDIDTWSVKHRSWLPKPVGSTDTEILYLALSRDRRDRRDVTSTLRNIEGRAALAWIDRERTDRVYLARAALSPLAIAHDAQGNLYWASNPRWFRDIDTMFGGDLGFHSITMVEEGCLLTVSVAAPEPVVEDLRRFTPTCRSRDSRLSDGVVWRGFDEADCAADKAQRKHKVAPTPRRSGWSTPAKHAWTPSTPAAGKGAATSSASRSLLDYDDTLSGVRRQTFASGLAAYDDDQSTLDEAWDEFDEIVADEEAYSAFERWHDAGSDPALVSILRNAQMPSEIDALMDEFDLSSVAAFNEFRTLVGQWGAANTEVSS